MPAFLPTVERLYSAALDAREWPEFLAAAADLLAAENAYVSTIEHDDRQLDYVVLRPLNWDQLSIERYTALMNDDPRIAAFRGSPGQAIHCGMTVSRQRLHASRIYQEALRPLDIEHTLLVGLPEPGGSTIHYLGLTRSLSDAPFDASDCGLLNELVPHLSRAFAVRELTCDANRQQDVLTIVLARLPYAAFVVDVSGRLRHLNEAARALSVAGLGLRVVRGRLQVDGSVENDRLSCALATSLDSMVSQKIVVKPSDLDLSLIVTIDPSTAGQRVNDDRGRLIVVSVEPLGRPGRSDLDRLRGLFGLSPSQTRLTLLLTSGRSLQDTAKALGITEASARQYLKIIFSKTGAKRQADLVRIVGHALSDA